VEGISAAKALSAGYVYSCAVLSGGTVTCWGGPAGTSKTAPFTIGGIRNAVAVAVRGGLLIGPGVPSGCAVLSTGLVKCWDELHLSSSVTVPGVRHAKAVSVGDGFACALLSGGAVQCWGDGYLGRGTMLPIVSSTPLPVRFGGHAPTTRPTKHGSAKRKATSALSVFSNRIEADLAQLARGRATLTKVLSNAVSCAIAPAAAAAQLGTVTSNREQTLRSLSRLTAPNTQAARIKSLLERALTASIASDRDYQVWLSHVTTSGGCSLPHDRYYQAAQREDPLATAAKRRFLAAFNPVARRLHLRTWSVSEF
jgi:hypothetical protein